jgi:aldehyde:ferredoxin oxidoreductase
MTARPFRVLRLHLDSGKADVLNFGDMTLHIGGSGLAAALYDEFGLIDAPHDHPDQPLIFAIGPLTGYFPLMSKVVCGFKSPYHQQYAESHAGGRLALAIRFSGYDALIFTGRAPRPSAACVSSRSLQVKDTTFLWGASALTSGRILRRTFPGNSGHRSILRIGPAGETGSAYACINVDTFRHFGRLGAGTVMGAKNLKGIVIQGDADLPLPDDAKTYNKLFRKVYEDMTATDMMRKYHNLGTPINVIPLNELNSLPLENLQKTTDPKAVNISGETFAKDLLLRNAACSGCPVGCIHLGMLRRQFQDDHRFMYRQVTYDHEPIFAMGAMLGIYDGGDVLLLLDDAEKQGLDCMSAGVALAWATEAVQKGEINKEQTIVPLAFGDANNYSEAIWHIGHASNDFYKALAQGAMHAASIYGGEDYACVLGQEMAGYATGEVFWIAQGLGFRHSHLDSGGYSYDQKHREQDVDKAVNFMVTDEQARCLLTSLVSCLFARGVYNDGLIAECLQSMGLDELAEDTAEASARVQRLRWNLRVRTGYDPTSVRIPKRFMEVVTWKGPQSQEYLDALKERYSREIMKLAE